MTEDQHLAVALGENWMGGDVGGGWRVFSFGRTKRNGFWVKGNGFGVKGNRFWVAADEFRVKGNGFHPKQIGSMRKNVCGNSQRIPSPTHKISGRKVQIESGAFRECG